MLPPTRRGAARSESARVAILSATARLFALNGYDHLTMEGIAAEAKVGKQTIYRWWPSKSELIADCLVEGLLIPNWFVPEDTGDLRADLTVWLDAIVSFIQRPGNESLLRSLVIAAAESEDVATRLNERLGVWMMVGERLAASRPDLPFAEVGEGLIGAVVLRTLRRGEFEDGFAARLVAVFLGPA